VDAGSNPASRRGLAGIAEIGGDDFAMPAPSISRAESHPLGWGPCGRISPLLRNRRNPARVGLYGGEVGIRTLGTDYVRGTRNSPRNWPVFRARREGAFFQREYFALNASKEAVPLFEVGNLAAAD
jgi:hypothetical protein